MLNSPDIKLACRKPWIFLSEIWFLSPTAVFIPFQFSSFSGFQLFLPKAAANKSSAVTCLKNQILAYKYFLLKWKGLWTHFRSKKFTPPPQKNRLLCNWELSFIICLDYLGHYVKYSTYYLILLSLQPYMAVLLLSPFYRWKNKRSNQAWNFKTLYRVFLGDQDLNILKFTAFI